MVLLQNKHTLSESDYVTIEDLSSDSKNPIRVTLYDDRIDFPAPHQTLQYLKLQHLVQLIRGADEQSTKRALSRLL
jgi:hypothetical protein